MRKLKITLCILFVTSLCFIAMAQATAETTTSSLSSITRSIEVDSLSVSAGSIAEGDAQYLRIENNESLKISSNALGQSETLFNFAIAEIRTLQTLKLALDVKSSIQVAADIHILNQSGYASLRQVDLTTDYAYIECGDIAIAECLINGSITIKISTAGSQHHVFYDKLSLVAEEVAPSNGFTQNYEINQAEIEFGTQANSASTLRFKDNSTYNVSSVSNKVAWLSKVTLDQTAEIVTSLVIEYSGKASTTTNNIWFSLWNYQTGNWDVFATIPLSPDKETRAIVISSGSLIEKYISLGRDIQFRLYNSHTSYFIRQTDYLNVKVCFESQKTISKLSPISYRLESGSGAGSLSDISVPDGNYLTISSNAQHKVALQTTFETDIPKDAIHTLTVSIRTSNTIPANNCYLSIYDYSLGSFTSYKNNTSNPTWETLSFSLIDPHAIANYISPSGEIVIRIYNSGSSAFVRYVDSVEVVIEKADHASYTIAQLSDVHELIGSQNFKSIISELNTKIKPDFTIITGDITDHGTPEQYALFQEDVKLLNNAVYITPGNHDVRWWNSNGKNDFVDNVGPLYQSFDYKGTHFALLDSTVFLESEARINKSQLQWLENDLQNIPKDQPVVYFAHHPFKLNKNGVARNELLRTARDNNLVAFMSGHVHNYGTFTEDGIPVTNITYIKDNAEQHFVTIEFTSRYMYVDKHKASDSSKEQWQKYSMNNTRKTTYTIDSVSAAAGGNVSVTVSILNAPDGVKQVKARIDNYGDYTDLTLGSDGKYHATINISQYAPALTYGEHFVGVEVFDKNNLKWVEFAGYTWQGGALSSQWTFETGDMLQSASTFFENNLYFSSYDRYIYSMNAATGNLNWKYLTGDSAISKPAIYPSTDSASILVGSNDTYLYSLNALDGSLNWKFKTGGSVISDPLIHNDLVIFGSGDNKIYALNASTGDLVWSRQANGLMRSQPTVYNNVLYAVVRDTYIWYAIDVLTGNLIWRGNANANESSFVCGDISPIVVNDKMWCIDANNVSLGYLSIETGSLAWTTTAGTTSTKGIATDGTLIFFVTNGGNIVNAVDSTTNQIVWSKDLRYSDSDNQAATLNSKLLYKNGFVFHFAERGRISMIDSSNGQLVAKFDAVGLPERNFWCNAEITDNQIFLSGIDGKLYCISYNTNALN